MNTYQDTLDWLFSQLPMYQRVGGAAYKADLSNTWALMDQLNNPQDHFPAVHIAGTNGKGSVSHMIASVLQTAGYKVGLYTSPHLSDFRERIRINGQMIAENEVVDFIQTNREFFLEGKFSFFEMTVGMAFEHFRKHMVDIAVIEVGMGGRLDSTNVVNPEVCAITNIGFDHMRFLGNTLPEIAGEKAGIIKAGVPVVIGEYQEETWPVFKQRANHLNAPLYRADQMKLKALESDLKGSYQEFNKLTALAVLEILNRKDWKIESNDIQQGLLNVVANTGLMGRWQLLGTEPMIICDTAHNKEGLQLVLKQLLNEDFEQLFIVLGTLADKDLDSILPLFPKQAYYYFTTPDIPRALSADNLMDKAEKFGLKGEVVEQVVSALELAKRKANPKDLIFVGGSTFVVAEVL